ncbi:MFS transporter [Streptomyces sp. NPDC001500]
MPLGAPNGVVRAACDVLRASGGYVAFAAAAFDGADDPSAWVAAARVLRSGVDRQNLLVGLPANRAGIAAVTGCLAEGIGVESTCVFSVPQYRAVLDAQRTGLLNVLNAVLCTALVLVSVLGLTLAADIGWTEPLTLGSFLAGAVLLALFTLRERGSGQPLVDPVLRRTRSLVMGCCSSALYMASVAGVEFYLVTLLLQDGRGYAPLAAGIAFLPLAACITFGNMIAGKLVGVLGVRRCLTLAFTVGAAGLVLLGLSARHHGYLVAMLPGLVVSGLGHGMIYTSMFVGGTRDVEDRNQGVAGALMTTTQYAGGAFGVAALILVLGTDPGDGAFRTGFLLAGGIAVAGAALAWLGFAPGAEPAARQDAPSAEAVPAPAAAGECR